MAQETMKIITDIIQDNGKTIKEMEQANNNLKTKLENMQEILLTINTMDEGS